MNTSRRNFVLAAGALSLAAALAGTPARASDAGDAAALVAQAQATLNAFAQSKDFPGFGAALAGSRGVLVFPQVLKAGFVLGGSGGNGVLLMRDEKTGDWRGPAFYTMGSASIGFQAGVSEAQVVMLVQTQKALDSLYTNKVKLGGDASVAVWKKGVGAGAGLSDFVAYSMVKGAFAGVAVDGSVLDVRQSLNQAYYGQPATPVDIVVKQAVSNPAAAGLQQTAKAAAKGK
jgi:lipid-binding SYLF domain-containing protein